MGGQMAHIFGCSSVRVRARAARTLNLEYAQHRTVHTNTHAFPPMRTVAVDVCVLCSVCVCVPVRRERGVCVRGCVGRVRTLCVRGSLTACARSWVTCPNERAYIARKKTPTNQRDGVRFGCVYFRI